MVGPEIEPGLNLWRVTRPDPTRPGRFWHDDPTRSLSVCFELKDYFDDDVLLMNASCQKSGLRSAHLEITKISNITRT